MDVFAILHWLTEEVSKLSGRATAADIHKAIDKLAEGGQGHRPAAPPAAKPAAPAVEAGQPADAEPSAPAAEPSTADVLGQVLAAIKALAPVDAAPAEPEPEPAPVVDQGEPAEA